MKVIGLWAIVLLVFPCLLSAQSDVNKAPEKQRLFGGKTIDRKVKSHQFGISLEGGFVYQTGEADENSPTPTVVKEQGTHFSLGVLYHWQFKYAFALRTQALIDFQETRANASAIFAEDYRTDLVNIAFPVQLLMGLSNVKYEPYVVLGGRFGLELAEERTNELPAFNNNNTFAIDMGIGMTFEFEKCGFRVRPELLSSFGMTNLWETSFSRDDLKRNTVSLRLIFHG